MIDAVVTISVEGTEVTAEMRYDSVLEYPLMYISSVKRRSPAAPCTAAGPRMPEGRVLETT